MKKFLKFLLIVICLIGFQLCTNEMSHNNISPDLEQFAKGGKGKGKNHTVDTTTTTPPTPIDTTTTTPPIIDPPIDTTTTSGVNVTYYDFEDGTKQGINIADCDVRPEACGEIISSPAIGNYALKFHYKGLTYDRAEKTLHKGILIDTDYWIGFSMNLLTWDNNSANSVVYQTHAASGQPGSSPVVGLRATGTQWKLTQEFDANRVTVWEGPVDKNVWVNWVIHVNYSTSSSGVLELYKNGELVYSYTGRTLAIGTTEGPYDKIGIYHGIKNEEDVRELVYDEIRYANDNQATFNDVTP